MKKLIPIIALTTALFSVGEVAQAQHTGLYVGLKTSLVFSPKTQNDLKTEGPIALKFDQNFKTGFALNAAVGYDWGKYLRTEFEFGYKFQRAQNVKVIGLKFPTHGTVRQFNFMSNIYVDVPLAYNFELFAGAGLGVSVIGAHNYAVDGVDVKIIKGSNPAFAYQFMGGVSYGISKNIDLLLEYRYFRTAEKSVKNGTNDTVKTELSSHNVGVGIRFNF